MERLVEKYDEKFMVYSMMEENRLFKYFDFCLEAFEVTFKQSNCQYGNMREGKK